MKDFKRFLNSLWRDITFEYLCYRKKHGKVASATITFLKCVYEIFYVIIVGTLLLIASIITTIFER